MSYDDTTFAAEGPSAGAPAAALLSVVEGAPLEVRSLDYDQEITLGRSRGCDWQFDDAQASRVQAVIRLDRERGLLVNDPGSRNGTFIDDVRIEGTEAWRPGQSLSFGGVRILATLTGSGSAEQEGASHEGPEVVASPAMVAVYALADRAAASDATVLVLGETGSGKEVLAQRIHARSGRAAKDFVTMNCGSVVESLAESTLFGHEKGAFTGASQRHASVFEQADGGTLFLDEVGELSASLQTRLLRVLEDGRVTRVGGTEAIDVDVRLIAATHRDLPAAVEAGTFREDLLYRLDVIQLTVPPLRERPEDIEPLTARFLEIFAPDKTMRLSAGATRALRAHTFPGNVRELRNCIERAVALAESHVIDEADLRLPVRRAKTAAGSLKAQVDDEEKRAVEDALRACGGNQTRAAKRLGIARRTLINKMNKYGISSKRS